MPWRQGPVDDRREFMKLYATGEYSISELCARAGVSRATAHKWINRWKADPVDGLLERSRAPHRRPMQTDAKWVELLLRLKQENPLYGPAKLVEMMADRDGQRPMAASTAGAILNRYGLVRHRRRRRHFVSGAGERPVDAPGAGHTMTADHKGQYRLGDRSYCLPLTLADPVSRYILALEALRSTSVLAAQPHFERVFREYGVPWQILSDNGAPFCNRRALGGLTRLSKWWIDVGSRPVRIDPGKPQQNGRHERMHRTLDEATSQPPANTIELQQVRFSEYRYEFNVLRPHEALGQRPPASAHVAYWQPFPEKIRPAEYSSFFEVRNVRTQGTIKWKGEPLFLSELLIGERVGIEHVDDDQADIWYRHVVIGTIDLRTNKIGPAVDRNDDE
jgi:putative transposase